MSEKTARIVVLPRDLKQIKNQFNQETKEKFKEKLDTKEKQIKQVKTFNQARRRFYKSFSQNSTAFTEIKFTAENNQYRAIFLVDGKTRSFIYIDTICKDTLSDNYRNSIQNEMFQSLSNNKEVVEAARDKCLKYVEQ